MKLPSEKSFRLREAAHPRLLNLKFGSMVVNARDRKNLLFVFCVTSSIPLELVYDP